MRSGAVKHRFEQAVPQSLRPVGVNAALSFVHRVTSSHVSYDHPRGMADQQVGTHCDCGPSTKAAST
jgi:hypothetical protein